MRRFSLAELNPLMKVSRFLAAESPRCGVVDVESGDASGRMRREVGEGLSDPHQPWISPTYLYDARGSELYEDITALPEYYPTRTEARLLEAIACDLAALSAPQEVVELGSGSSTKTEQILAAVGARIRPLTYLPIDVSPTMLEASAERLGATYPKLRVLGLSGTYEDGFRALPPAMDRLFVFLGGTIGNFPPAYQRLFFERLSAVMRPGKIMADRPLTALEAIMEAGGFDNNSADMEAVVVIRKEGDKTVNHTVNLKLVLEGKATGSFYLKPSDILYIPKKFSWF